MKTKFVLTGILGIALLAMAAPRTWTFTKGATFEGDYVSAGTTTVVVRKNGTNNFLNISDLSTNDQAYVAEMQFTQRQARLDAEAKQMAAAGMMEFTTKLIENFPERVNNKHGWMDAEFLELDKFAGRYPEKDLGFKVLDKTGEQFSNCYIPKEWYGGNFVNGTDYNDKGTNDALISVVNSLRKRDKVRFVGLVEVEHVSSDSVSPPDCWFVVEKIEMIETAAEKKAREQQDATTP